MTEPQPQLSRSQRNRVQDRAAKAWIEGKPHKALEIFRDAGIGDEYPQFVRVASSWSRRRYLKRITP